MLTAQKPRFSIILPVYNGRDTIARAIASVARQTYPDWELVIINDGSTDETAQIIADCSQALGIQSKTRILTQKNQGVAVARNYGLAHAEGEYFAFLDADDVWLPDKLSVDVQTLERSNSPVSVVYGAYTMVDADGWPIHQSPLFTQSGNIFEQMITNEGHMLPSNTLVHREIVEEIGVFPTDCFLEDRPFFLLASRSFPSLATGERKVLYQQTTSGRCRNILSDYAAALASERSIAQCLVGILSPEDVERLWVMQQRFLISRFLMYGFMDFARRLARDLNAELAQNPQLAARVPQPRDKKTILCMLSLTSGFNLLEPSRRLYQSLFSATHRSRWKPVRDELYKTSYGQDGLALGEMR